RGSRSARHSGGRRRAHRGVARTTRRAHRGYVDLPYGGFGRAEVRAGRLGGGLVRRGPGDVGHGGGGGGDGRPHRPHHTIARAGQGAVGRGEGARRDRL